jgi:hypothetical protein
MKSDSRQSWSVLRLKNDESTLRIVLFRSIVDALYWIQLANPPVFQVDHGEGFDRMTYLDVVFNYASPPGENEMRAIDTMRDVYGILRVRFNEKEKSVHVLFDASRLKRDAVARMLRQAGIDIGEPSALA